MNPTIDRLQLSADLESYIRAARRSPLGLYKYAFRDAEGGPIIVKDFHRRWFDLLLHHRNLLIEAPRGSAKTSVILAYILWRLGHNQNLRIKLVCDKDEEAAKRIAEIKQHIQDPRGPTFYNVCFPSVRLDKTQKNDHLNLTLVRDLKHKDYTIEARGVLSSGTGSRSDIIIFDDICTYKNTIQEPSTRPKVKQKVLGDWLPTKAPKKHQVVSIFTPYHEEDVNAHLIASGKPWHYDRIAHGKPDDPFHSIFPEVFSRAYLIGERDTLGPTEYARAYLCKRITSDAQIITTQDLHISPHPLPPPPVKDPDRLFAALKLTSPIDHLRILSVDPSGGKSKGETDYMGFTLLDAWNLEPNAPTPYHIHVQDTYQARLSTNIAAKHIVELCQTIHPDVLLIESQGAVSLDQWVLQEAPHLPLVPYPAKRSKQARLEAVQPLFAHDPPVLTFHPQAITNHPSRAHEKFTLLIHGQPHEAQRPLRRQLLNFPTTHDDALDSLTQALGYLSRHFLKTPIQDPTPSLKLQVISI